MFIAFQVLVVGIIGGFLNWIRGGGIGHIIPRPGRSLYWVSLAIFLIMIPFVGMYTALFLGLMFLFGGVRGHGSYFDCGQKASGYQDDPEVAWIDWILLKLFGPEWALSSEGVSRYRLQGVEVKPLPEDATIVEKIKYKLNTMFIVRDVKVTNQTRPIEWRQKRDCAGMALRGLHYLPFFLVIPIAFGSWLALLPIIGLVLFAPLYFVSRILWDMYEDRFGSVHWKVFSGTALSEWLTGILFWVMVWIQYLISV